MNETLVDNVADKFTDIESWSMRNSTDNQTTIEYPDDIFAKYEFLREKPMTAFSVLTAIAIASLSGIFGNILILLAVSFSKKFRPEEIVFIFNLALSDLYVAAIAEPMSIIGKYNILFALCKGGNFIFISGRGSTMSSAKQGKSGSIYNLSKN